MVEYRVANVAVDNVELHTADVSFDVERSDDDGSTWKVVGSNVIEKMKNRIDMVAAMREIHSVANAIAHRDTMITDTIEGAKVLLSKTKIGPKAIEPIVEEPEKL